MPDAAAWEEELKGLVISKVKEKTGIDITSLIEVEHRFYPKVSWPVIIFKRSDFWLSA